MRELINSTLLLSAIICCVILTDNSVAAQSDSLAQAITFTLPTGKHYRVAVERDGTVAKNAEPKKIKIIGVIKGVAVVLVDTYRSIPGGMSYCQAGNESFLRVISIASKKPVETFHVKLESCRDNIELASPGIEWLPQSSQVVIHWLQGPNASAKAETRTLNINNHGGVHP